MNKYFAEVSDMMAGENFRRSSTEVARNGWTRMGTSIMRSTCAYKREK